MLLEGCVYKLTKHVSCAFPYTDGTNSFCHQHFIGLLYYIYDIYFQSYESAYSLVCFIFSTNKIHANCDNNKL
jgi:hypothetical protein